MNPIFGSVYADAYDHIYRDKDYDDECRLLKRLFGEYAAKPVRRISRTSHSEGRPVQPAAQAVIPVRQREAPAAALRARRHHPGVVRR